jgi:hypothetical protein
VLVVQNFVDSCSQAGLEVVAAALRQVCMTMVVASDFWPSHLAALRYIFGRNRPASHDLIFFLNE